MKEYVQLSMAQKARLKASPCFLCKSTKLAVVKDCLTTDESKFFYYVECQYKECFIVGYAGETIQQAIDLWIKENNN